MARPVTILKSLAAGSATAIAASQSLAAAGSLVINGSAASGGVATLDSQRQVVIASAGNDSGLTWTVSGTDDTGNFIKDRFAGANAGTAVSNLSFRTVTSITGSAATASTVTVGTNTTGSSPWNRFDPHVTPPYLSLGGEVVSGTPTWQVDYCYEEFLLPAPNPLAPIPQPAYAAPSPTPKVFVHPLLQAETGAAEGAIDFPVSGWRLTLVAIGTVKLTGTQAGIIQG